MIVTVVTLVILGTVLQGNGHCSESNNGLSVISSPTDTDYSANDYIGEDIDECYETVFQPYPCGKNYSYIENYDQLPDNDSTKMFILKHRNEKIRKILATQLRYCPSIALCSFSLELSIIPPITSRPCCSSCSCDENCFDISTCCPDIVVQDVKRKHSMVPTACTHMYLNLNMAAYRSRQYYGTYTVQSCPVDSIASNCEQNYHKPGINLSFLDILPVVHLTTGIVYRNIHCALCNGVMEEEVQSFDPYVGCQYESMPKYESEYELIDHVLSSDTNCDIWFQSDVSTLSNCRTMISQCNVTGQWQAFDPLFVEACKLYTSPIEIEYNVLFKNVFCAMCNGHVDMPVMCYTGELNYNPDIDFSFSGLLSYNKAEERSVSDQHCVKQTSKSKDECEQLYCSERRLLVGDTCVRHLLGTEAFYYDITLRLTPNKNHRITVAMSDTDNVLNTLHHFIVRQLRLKVLNSSNTDVCSLGALVESNDACNHSDNLNILNGHIASYYVRMSVYISELHDPETVLETIQNLQSVVVSSDTFREVVYITITNKYNLKLSSSYLSSIEKVVCSGVKKTKIERVIHIPVSGQWCRDRLPSEPLTPLQSLLICPLVKINNETYPWKIHETGITIIESNYNVSDRYFFYATDEDTVFYLCKDEYLRSISEPDVRSFRITAEVIVSNALTTVSIICLFVTLLVFTILKTLRNLPGKNNIALVSWLLIAQVFYTLVSYSPFYMKVDSLACKLIGLFTHFSWLVVLLWMNVCTYHVCKVMTKIRAKGYTSENKTYGIYHVYCITMAASFVTINTVVSSVTTENSSIGYGGSACYITSENMKLYTFALPVGLVIVSNLVMFLIVVIRIKRGSTVKRNVQNERNELAIFAKLSTLTGLTWIFGFVYIWTQFVVFNYVFIVLNAGQGVFLMIALVCNRRVYAMFREIYRSRARETHTVSGQVHKTAITSIQ